MNIRRATQGDKDMYEGLYPLYGYVGMGDTQIIIEDLRGFSPPGDPIYEARAPEGYSFDYGLHGLLGFTLADLRERLDSHPLQVCEADCHCKE